MSESLSMTLIWGNKNSLEILPTNKLREMFHKTRSISNNLFAYSDLIRVVYRENNCKIYNFQILGWKDHVLVNIGFLNARVPTITEILDPNNIQITFKSIQRLSDWVIGSSPVIMSPDNGITKPPDNKNQRDRNIDFQL